jgi:16S rRNA (cytosine1402-N4)-methyltransferase
MAEYHEPVLLTECLDGLAIRADGVYVDCTLGGGGHSEAIASRLAVPGCLHSFDRDADAIAFARKRLAPLDACVVLHECPFSALGDELPVDSVDGVLYDLGISSYQVDESTRGFTFTGTEPLDLRMDRSEPRSAQEYLREVSVDDLAGALRLNADMDRAGKLAFRLKDMVALKSEVILPGDVRAVVESVFPDRRRDMNSLLARVFQAIRMEVNRELEEIRVSLRAAVACLRKGGRLCVISYHSVEDRCVKQTLAEFEKDCLCPESLPVCMCGGKHRQLLKVERKPVLPSAGEIARNGRARSAKLRIYQRV